MELAASHQSTTVKKTDFWVLHEAHKEATKASYSSSSKSDTFNFQIPGPRGKAWGTEQWTKRPSPTQKEAVNARRDLYKTVQL